MTATKPKNAPKNDDADIAAEVEAQLAAQREALTTKLRAEREEARRAAAVTTAKKVPELKLDKEGLAQLQRMLAAAGVKLVPLSKTTDSDEDDADVPLEDYSDTQRVQDELLVLLDLLGLVRRQDVQDHVYKADGSRMTDSNVRYHMKKLANRGLVHKVEERYYLDGLGYRTRDVWSKDPQKLLEVLEGKKTVRS